MPVLALIKNRLKSPLLAELTPHYGIIKTHSAGFSRTMSYDLSDATISVLFVEILQWTAVMTNHPGGRQIPITHPRYMLLFSIFTLENIDRDKAEALLIIVIICLDIRSTINLFVMNMLHK